MLVVVLLIAAMSAILLAAWWPDGKPEPDETVARFGDADRAARAPTSLEGALSSQLFGGEITPEQYRRAVASLAVRDERRHPLAVPGEEPPRDDPREPA